MADMLPETDAGGGNIGFEKLVRDLGGLLQDHKGADVLVLDIRQINDWTDFFVIATAASNTHLDGLERHVKEFCSERNIEILRKSRRPAAEDGWRLIDLGRAVVHLMSAQARDFYELERLWSSPPAQNPYSSKSS